MYLFKSSGATYKKVVRGAVHAFPHAPAEANLDELVFLSKNREDCRPSEKQIRFVGKSRDIRLAEPSELEEIFPGVGAGERWSYVIRLYGVRPIPMPFNLDQIDEFDDIHYRTVQGFARIRESDLNGLFSFLVQCNPQLIVDLLNASGPEEDADPDS